MHDLFHLYCLFLTYAVTFIGWSASYTEKSNTKLYLQPPLIFLLTVQGRGSVAGFRSLSVLCAQCSKLYFVPWLDCVP